MHWLRHADACHERGARLSLSREPGRTSSELSVGSLLSSESVEVENFTAPPYRIEPCHDITRVVGRRLQWDPASRDKPSCPENLILPPTQPRNLFSSVTKLDVMPSLAPPDSVELAPPAHVSFASPRPSPSRARAYIVLRTARSTIVVPASSITVHGRSLPQTDLQTSL